MGEVTEHGGDPASEIMKIKVVQVIGSLQVGGAENQVIQLLNGIDATRFERHLVCFSSPNTPFGRALGPRIHRHFIPLPRWGQVGCILRLIILFRRLRPHIVQAHMFHTNLYVALAAKLAKVPVFITTEHGKNLWKKKPHHLIERHIISPLSDLRVAVSNDILNIRVKSKDVPISKITVIPPCVRVSDHKSYYEWRGMIGAVGRMVKPKDYPTLLKALRHVLLREVDVKLTFLGDGPEKPRLMELASRLGINRNVSFLGFKTNVLDYLLKMDVVAFSSVREGVPVAMLEAMAAGVPVVATEVGGIPEVIKSGVDGLLVPPRDPFALGNAIIKLAMNAELRTSIGLNAKQKVMSCYSRGVICRRYESLFISLLAKKGLNVQQP